ncbi:MAG: M15 family metallopeptidase [Shewanella sp.]|nr:M15 family metallopeptidase [Shewanella sp.]
MFKNLNFDNLHLYGLDDQHLVDYQCTKLETETCAAFQHMVKAALSEGIDLQICSGYRSFERQLFIWNNKVSGKRTVLDLNSNPIDIEGLNKKELIKTIMNWSALPGTSRHHWGTDIDVFDGNTITNEDLKLIPQEYQINGPCYKLHSWLKTHAHRFGFFFPYQEGKSGVNAEPWHLSYAPVSCQYIDAFIPIHLENILNAVDIHLYIEIQSQLPELLKQYFYFIAPIADNMDRPAIR